MNAKARGRRRRPARPRDTAPGMAAQYPDTCDRCPNSIAVGDRIVFQRGRPIHVGCASGADDE